MIVRIWHGRTSPDKGEEYARFLADRAIPEYRSIPGNISSAVLRRATPEATHFITLSLWESEQAIEAFAGKPISKPKYHPEDPAFLLELEPEVVHYQVFADSGKLTP